MLNYTNMKKIFFVLLSIIMPLCANAQVDELFDVQKKSENKISEEATAKSYSVPEVDGRVVFTKTIEAPGKSKSEIYAKIGSWADRRFQREATRGEWPNDNFFENLMYASVKEANKAEGRIVCQGAENLIFTKRALVKNWTECYYITTFTIEDGKVNVKVGTISYVYRGSGNDERIKAEDWITDKETFTKSGKPRKNPAKFRAKTVGMVNQIYKEIAYILK